MSLRKARSSAALRKVEELLDGGHDGEAGMQGSKERSSGCERKDEKTTSMNDGETSHREDTA